ncbi:MAG: ATP-dependent zinc metalloprotease FtsH [Dehalococcoidia bacterium]|nr:ATP-dependent zinc metalloprotease FtsH [Dehalococcoidia bacterium]
MRNSFIWLLVVVGVIAVFLYYVGGRIGGTTEEPISTVIELAKQEGAVQSIEVRDRDLTVITATGEIKSRLPEYTDILTLFRSEGVELGTSGITIDAKGSSGFGSFLRILLNFLPLIFFGGLILFMMRQAQGSSNQAMGFGRSKAKLWMVNRSTVTFADVAGVEEAKQELEEVVEYLKYKERFLSLGARIPKGVLLVGQPGTGKTLLAKAVAGEAGAPFFSISGSEFVEMFVGVGAARVRDLFDQARRNSPCIVFVDEIDAVGRHRGAGVGGGHDEREQTLNQILVEMDGFDTDTNIIIIAATNRPDILDPALLRPGRFDRRVVLDLPELMGRTAILKVHASGKPLGPDVSLEVLAKQTPGFSGADLSNLVNEAALLAARVNKKLIGMTEFEESIDRVIAGPERKSRIISAREKEMTAYHEAGHALVAWKLPHADSVHKISIVARGGMGGYTRLLPDEDRYLMTKNQFEDMLATSLGGRISEEMVFDEITTGASNDLENATRIALKMIKQYGMSDGLGLRTFGRREELVFLGKEIHEERDYSDKVAEDIDKEVQALINQAYARAKDILTSSRDKLDEVANYLIKNETIEGDDLKRLFDGLPLEAEGSAPSPEPEASHPPVIAPTPGPLPQPNPTMPSRQDQGPSSEAQPS